MAREPSPETDLQLRPAQRDDLDGIHDVFVAATAGTGHPPERRTPAQVRAWIEQLPESGQEVWVSTHDEVLLGFVTVREDWVPLLFVHPDRPAHGVGEALLELVKGLRPQGFGLRVHQENERARAFYRRHGLVELESTDGSAYDDAHPDLRMAWLGEDPLTFLRRRIDEVDDELAVLLARRTALTGAVQDHKAATNGVAGERGRDEQREAEIVDRMSRHVPDLGRDQIRRVMRTVIEESLQAWERRSG